MKSVYRKRFAVEELMLEYQKVVAQRDQLKIACQFLISQVERLAERSFSEGVEDWISKNDAVNCGKQAISNCVASNLKDENATTAETKQT